MSIMGRWPVGRRVVGVVVSLVAVAAVIFGILTATGSHQASTGQTTTHRATTHQAASPRATTPAAVPSQRSAATPVNAAIPQRAWDTLARIDAGTWPPRDGSGTKGGTTWTNREGNLPKTGAGGKSVSYLEWDVNLKKPGRNRDAERIVTGNDGSAWYTADHYATFTRMR